MSLGFVAGKLVWLLCRFSTVALLLGLVGTVTLWTRRAHWGRRMVGMAFAGLWAALLLPIGPWLLWPLESRFPPVTDPPAQVDGIIVLGGAVDTLLTERYGIPALNDAAERMTTFVMLARRYPAARLAFTGGSGLLEPGRLSEADVARALFKQLGLERPVTFETRSRTTYENALLLREALGPRPGGTWVLVTSAFHMPRAVGTFRAAGWTVLPWPVGYKAEPSVRHRLDQGLPDQLQAIEMAEHEWIGLLAYRLLGRTDALLPAPSS